MMPYLKDSKSKREMISAFGGYNANTRIAEGEWSSSDAITLDKYPVFSNKQLNGQYFDNTTKIDAAIVKDKLYFITYDTHKLYEYPGRTVGSDAPTEILGITLNAIRGHKLVSFGAYILILPEKIWINTAARLTEPYETYDHGEMEASCDYSIEDTLVRSAYYLINYYNKDSQSVQISDNKQDAIDDNDVLFWNKSLKKLYKANTDTETSKTTWEEYSGTIITSVDFGGQENNTDAWKCSKDGVIEPEDYVEIKETIDTANNSTEIINHGYYKITKWFPDSYGSFSVEGVLFLEGNCSINEKISFARKMPQMDYVFENNNRLWGCRYGTNNDGEFVNEIYASMLGDFKNWTKYAGISTDSYAASIGTDGPFTGACAYLGYPTFFKENYIHKVYGSYPAQYQIQTTACPDMGVMAGSENTLSICNYVLYYKARNCICAYQGSYPVSVSSALGNAQFNLIKGVAGSARGKYHICLEEIVDVNSVAESVLFVYYPALKKWMRSDPSQTIDYFIPYKDDLLYGSNSGNCFCYYGTVDKRQNPDAVTWYAESGIWQITSPDKKYVSKLVLRMKLGAGAKFDAEIEYDSSGNWIYVVQNLTGSGLASFNLPIIPRRCDHIRLRLSGEGECEIYSITKTIEQGSDV